MTDTNTDSQVPAHVGIILDGNRRWAREQGLPTLEGHRRGADEFGNVIEEFFSHGVEYISAFVFSTENWSRTEEEVKYLMNLVLRFVDNELMKFHKSGIKIVILGSRENLNPKVLEAIEKTESTTAENTRGTLALCFNYGGHEELVQAVRQIVASDMSPADVTAETLAGYLYHPDVPPVDLLIRTSGEQRLSGFMLYRAAYAELLFIDKYWPDFTREDAREALAEYSRRQRRFGG